MLLRGRLANPTHWDRPSRASHRPGTFAPALTFPLDVLPGLVRMGLGRGRARFRAGPLFAFLGADKFWPACRDKTAQALGQNASHNATLRRDCRESEPHLLRHTARLRTVPARSARARPDAFGPQEWLRRVRPALVRMQLPTLPAPLR